MTDQLAVSFDRDQTGKVVGLKLHQGGVEFEVPREGIVLTPEIPLDELQRYVGRYAGAAAATEFDIFVRNGRLAVRLPNNTSFDLRPPDATGRRATRANVGIGVTFEESETGGVAAMNVHRPGGVPVLRVTPTASTLPTVDEIMTLRRIPAASRLRADSSAAERFGGQVGDTMRATGTVRFPQSAAAGRFATASAGDDRLRLDLDIDGAMQVRTVLNDGRATQATSRAPFRELTGKELAQMRLEHPAVLFGDWRRYYDGIRVIRAGALGERKVYGIQLESAGLPRTLVAVDAETGDVLQTQQTMWSAGAGAIPVTTTYSDYREVGGMRVPHRYVSSTDMTGRTIFDVERVEVGIELPRDTFTLQPTTESDRGR